MNLTKHSSSLTFRNLRALILGPSGSGKSYIMQHFLLKYSIPFDFVTVFTDVPQCKEYNEILNNNKHYNKSNFKIFQWSSKLFNELYKARQNEVKLYKKAEDSGEIKIGSYMKYLTRWLIILNDFSTDIKKISQLLKYSRHLNINFIIIGQYYSQFPPMLRTNSNVIFFKSAGSNRDMEIIYKEIHIDISYNNFKKVFKYITETRKWGTFVFAREGKNSIEYL